MSAESKYNKYLTSHISGVKKAFEWLRDNVSLEAVFEQNVDMTTLELIIFEHDDSKYSDEEYDAYANYFYGNKTDEVKRDFDYAWLHHQNINKHHWQYWVLINDEDGTYALDMDVLSIIEMVCDWWSFSFNKNNLEEIFDWYDEHSSKMIFSDETRYYVERLLRAIKDKLHE